MALADLIDTSTAAATADPRNAHLISTSAVASRAGRPDLVSTSTVAATAAGLADPALMVRSVVTSNDAGQLVEAQSLTRFATGPTDQATVITVDPSTTYQSMVGYGATMTEASAVTISRLPATVRDRLMADLFDPVNGIGLSFIRATIGGCDFALSDYTYADTKGASGAELSNFSLARDDLYVVPRVKQALALNPVAKVMATPWSPPAWMRTGGTLKGTTGGTLDPAWYSTYAQYFVLYVQGMATRGIPISYLSVQNEPDFAPTYMGMTMTSAQQIVFIRDYLRPALNTAGLGSVGILGWDHNWDQDSGTTGNQTTFVAALISDAGAKAALVAGGGVAWHGYLGDATAQGTIHTAHPTVDLFFTEGTEFGTADFSQDVRYNARSLTIGAVSNWARSVALWNFALDTSFGPQNGGSTNVRGLVQVDVAAGTYVKQPAYYGLGQASKLIRPGALRVARTSSNPYNIIYCEAFRNPDGTLALQVLNDGGTPQPATLKWGALKVNVVLATGVTTYRWSSSTS